MVKNTTGGSRHKKQARKNANADHVRQRTRLKDPKESCEMYAIVTRNFGQGNCEVMCNDGINRMCVIRNKFKGRNKRGNRVDIGIRVLVGLRDWEVRAGDKKEKCDLLEVYDNRELEDLKKDPNFDEKLLRSEQETYGEDKGGTAMFEFKYTNDDDSNEILAALTQNSKISEQFEEINVDDI